MSTGDEIDTLVKWNDTHKKYPFKYCLQELIEQQVSQHSARTALRFLGRKLSYTELNERANRCARYLRKLGVGPDSIVGVLMERSIEMVVALLGILKAGGAYLPLDPSYPEERLSFMLNDAGVWIILTQEKNSHLVRDFEGTKLSLDREWDYLSKRSGG
jgi:non-ribosomal peptide synthetase component F